MTVRLLAGLVIHAERHNEITDCIGHIAAQVWTQVVSKPIVIDADIYKQVTQDCGLIWECVVFGILK